MRPLLHQDTFVTVFGTAYLGLMTGFLASLGVLPLLVLLLGTDPARSWPLAVLLAPLFGPAFTGACAVFRAHAVDGSAAVVRPFAIGWWRGLGRSLALGALGCGVLTVLAVDVAAVWGRTVGAAVIPVLVISVVLTAAGTVQALVVAHEVPQARLRDVVRTSLVVVVRRWYLSGFSLTVLWVFALVVGRSPAVGLGIALGPALFLVWANCRRALAGVLDASSAPHSV